MKKLYFLIALLCLSISSFSQNIGVGTTNPQNRLHIVSPADPLRIEGLQNYNPNTDTVLLITDPAMGVVKYIHVDSLRSELPNLDSIIIQTLLSNTDTLFSIQSFRDSIINIIQGNVDSIIINTIVNNADTLFVNQSFVDSIISTIYNNGDTLLTKQSFRDTIYSFVSDSLLRDSLWISNLDSILALQSDSIFFNDTSYQLYSDSLLNDTAWLRELRDSLSFTESNVDSANLLGTVLSVFEENDTAWVDLLPLASDSSFYSTIRDSLLRDSLFTSTIDSLILSDSNFISGIVDTLLSSSRFTDSIFTLNRDSLLLDRTFRDSIFTILRDSLVRDITHLDSIYSYTSDSLLNDTAWLRELRDSLSFTESNVDSANLSGTVITVYEEADQASTDLLPLASDSSFYSAIRDSLLRDSLFTSTIDSLILSDSNFISGIVDTLLSSSRFTDSIFTLNRDSLLVDRTFRDSIFTILRDSLVRDIIHLDSIYSYTSDSLLNDTAWLRELRDSLSFTESNVDSANLSGTVITVYEEADQASTDLLPLASDSSFYSAIRDSLLRDSLFTSTVDSLISSVNTADTLLSDNRFTDSIFTLVRDSLIRDLINLTNVYSYTSDSLLNDTAWLSELKDSVESNIDSATLQGTIITVYEETDQASTDLLPLASDSNFYSTIKDSLVNDTEFRDSIREGTLYVDVVNAVGNLSYTLPSKGYFFLISPNTTFDLGSPGGANTGRYIQIHKTPSASSTVFQSGTNQIFDPYNSAFSNSISLAHTHFKIFSDGTRWIITIDH